uniref:Uncharacterized protein n=1 Tax=Rhizophora mucronata TaxID=61149 RepID=A0A2P2J1W8_RHIMU
MSDNKRQIDLLRIQNNMVLKPQKEVTRIHKKSKVSKVRSPLCQQC